MSIFFVCFSLRPGGVAKVLGLLVSKLAAMDINVAIITDEKSRDFAEKNFGENVAIFFRPEKEKKLLFLRGFLKRNAFADECFFVGVQFNNLIWLSLAGLLLLRRPSVISWEHSSPAISIVRESPFKAVPIIAIRFFCLAFSDACFFVSRGAKKNARYITPFWVKKIFTPNAVYCSDSVGYVRSPDGVASNRPLRIVSVGRVSREKGLDIAFSALSEVNFDWEYIIVGDGPELPLLKENVAKNKKIARKVKFLGWLEDPKPIIANSDVLLLASYYEGMPTVIIEACLLEIPIISSNCISGPSEIIVPCQNGLLFKVGDYKDLVNKLTFFVERKHHFQNSSEYVRDYEVTSAAEQFVKNLYCVVSR